MNKYIKPLLVICFWLLPALACAESPTEWKQITHGGLSFSIPADWTAIKEREFEGQWGIRDDEKRQGVAFSISRERRPEGMLKGAEKDGMEVKALGPVSFGALPGEKHQISGQMKGAELFVRVAILEGLLPDGDRITFSTSLIDMPLEEWQPVIEQVMSSVTPTPELVTLLQGYSRHELFDGLISLEVRNNWKKTEHSDNVSWKPPLVSIYGGGMIRFAHGYHLTGSRGLLSKMKDPVVEKSEMYGIPAWKILGTGVGVAYTSPMRNKTVPATTVLYLADICLAEGDRFGYAITASDEQLAEHKAELEKLLASVKLNLPEQAGPCDDLVTYEWNEGMKVGVPRSWRKNQDTKYHLSWYDKSLITGADIKASLSHSTTNVHPITGYEHPAETLEQLTIDGYPATHYRKTYTGSDKVEVIYDYYIIDARMRFKDASQQNTPSFFVVQFSTRPAAVAVPDTATHKRVLESIVFGPEWASETPVVRAEHPVSVVQPADDQPVQFTAKTAGEVTAKSARDEVQPASGDAIPAVAEEVNVEQERGVVEVADPAIDQQADPVADTPLAAEGGAIEPVQVEEKISISATKDQAADTLDAPVKSEPDDAVAVDLARQRYEQASALRTEGAVLQQQGRLAEAIEKYRGSLALYPDDRLEAHVRLIEKILNGGN